MATATELLGPLLPSGTIEEPQVPTAASNRSVIANFYCAAYRLVVEIKGDIHDLQPERNTSSAACLQQGGYELMRLRNEQLLDPTEGVLDGIVSACFRPCRSEEAHLRPAAESGKAQ